MKKLILGLLALVLSGLAIYVVMNSKVTSTPEPTKIEAKEEIIKLEYENYLEETIAQLKEGNLIQVAKDLGVSTLENDEALKVIKALANQIEIIDKQINGTKVVYKVKYPTLYSLVDYKTIDEAIQAIPNVEKTTADIEIEFQGGKVVYTNKLFKLVSFI